MAQSKGPGLGTWVVAGAGIATIAGLGIWAWHASRTSKNPPTQVTYDTPVGPLPEKDYLSFDAEFTCFEVESPYTVMRYYGGGSQPQGHYFSLDYYADSAMAIASLALPAVNTCECRAVYFVRPGARVCLGRAAPLSNAGLPGGGSQLYVFDLDALTYVDTTCGFSTWTYSDSE
jgi:hypothetical protein